MEISLDMQFVWNEKDTADTLEEYFNCPLYTCVVYMGMKKGRNITDRQCLPEGLGWGKRESINLKSLFSHGILEFILSKHTCTPM